MTNGKRRITYVTSSEHKKQENKAFLDVAQFEDGICVSNHFDFTIREVRVQETLEVDLEVLVREEVKRAYGEIGIPCIVEHAGLIFEEYEHQSYPGGLTKPMWNALGDGFLTETQSAGRRAIARAVVAYCNGRSIRTFVGDMSGRLANEARGSREFYWDTVFIPDLERDDIAFGLTYAEIADDGRMGLKYKMKNISQSAKAMLSFLQSMRCGDRKSLWHS